MQRSAVRLAKNGGRSNAHLAAGARDPYGDFPAIGDEDFLEHTAKFNSERILARHQHASNQRHGGVADLQELETQSLMSGKKTWLRFLEAMFEMHGGIKLLLAKGYLSLSLSLSLESFGGFDSFAGGFGFFVGGAG
jgi:hypothetical protein